MESAITPKSYFKNPPRKHRKCFPLQVLFIGLLLQQAISGNSTNSTTPSFFGFFSYADELCALVLFFIFCWKFINGFRLTREENRILLLFFGMVGLGLISNAFSGLQPLRYVLVDVFTCGRFIFAYLGIRSLHSGRVSDNFLYDNFNGIAKLFAVVCFVLMLHDYFFQPFFPLTDFRYFAFSTRLFYSHPTFLANSCIILICLLTVSFQKDRSNLFYVCLLATVTVMTLRTKAIGFVVLFFLLLFSFRVLQVRSKFFLFLPIVLGGFCVGWKQIQYYYFAHLDFARSVMARDCLKLANRFFPLGTGFATYGSYMATVHYSPLYQTLGYDNVYGLSSQSPYFLSDTFWPIITAQFGYFGLILFLLIVITFFQIAFRFQKHDPYRFVALISILIYMLISSSSESSFFNPFSVLYFLVFGLLVGQKSESQYPVKIPRGCPSKYIKQPLGMRGGA